MSRSAYSQKATREMTREHNQRLVLNHIYDHGPISRAHLARMTGLTRSTISTVVARLMDGQLVLEMGRTRSSVGKPATLLEFNAEMAHIISLDIASTTFKGFLFNLRGEHRGEVEQSLEHQRGELAIRDIISLVTQLKSKAKRPILGIGIGSPGVIEPVSGLVRCAADLGWENIPLKKILEDHFNLPTYIANDSQISALAQYVFGCGKKVKNLILVNVGRGLGAGIIINGKMFAGDGFGAGEIGHVVIKGNNKICECGQTGCLETLVGTKSLVRTLKNFCDKEAMDDQVKAFCQSGRIEDLVNIIGNSRPEVNKAIEGGAQVLGSALALLIGVLNIRYVYIAGEMTQLGNTFLEPLQHQTKSGNLPVLINDIKINVSELEPSTVTLGAAALVLQQMLGLD